MQPNANSPEQLDRQALQFYRHALAAVQRSGVPFLVGGAYALNYYTGVARHTKDFDFFTRPDDAPRILEVLRAAGCHTEIIFPHWLGKAFHQDNFVDVIFSSGNGMCPVDDGWFEHAVVGTVFDVPARLCPAEEMIWQKAYIMERERFDGADVAHLIRARGPELDWDRLLRRFGPHWRILLGHLVLFGFIYPAERGKVPGHVLTTLIDRLHREMRKAAPSPPVCRGTLLSRMQYLTDTEQWGYLDARLVPRGHMSEEEIEEWTAAGLNEK
jgi:hypothetical protein